MIFLVLKKFMVFLREDSRCLVFPVERSVFPIFFPSKNVLVPSSGKVGVAPLFLPSKKGLCPRVFLHKNSETSEKQFLVKNWSCFFVRNAKVLYVRKRFSTREFFECSVGKYMGGKQFVFVLRRPYLPCEMAAPCFIWSAVQGGEKMALIL